MTDVQNWTLRETLNWIAFQDPSDDTAIKITLRRAYGEATDEPTPPSSEVADAIDRAKRSLLAVLQDEDGTLRATGLERVMPGHSPDCTALCQRSAIAPIWWVDADIDAGEEGDGGEGIAHMSGILSVPGTCQYERVRFPRKRVLELWPAQSVPSDGIAFRDIADELAKVTGKPADIMIQALVQGCWHGAFDRDGVSQVYRLSDKKGGDDTDPQTAIRMGREAVARCLNGSGLLPERWDGSAAGLARYAELPLEGWPEVMVDAHFRKWRIRRDDFAAWYARQPATLFPWPDISKIWPPPAAIDQAPDHSDEQFPEALTIGELARRWSKVGGEAVAPFEALAVKAVRDGALEVVTRSLKHGQLTYSPEAIGIMGETDDNIIQGGSILVMREAFARWYRPKAPWTLAPVTVDDLWPVDHASVVMPVPPVVAPPSASVEQAKAKHAGGSPGRKDRTTFNQEVTRRAALDGVGGRTEFRKEMKEWAAGNMDPVPDDRSIERWIDELVPASIWVG